MFLESTTSLCHRQLHAVSCGRSPATKYSSVGVGRYRTVDTSAPRVRQNSINSITPTLFNWEQQHQRPSKRLLWLLWSHLSVSSSHFNCLAVSSCCLIVSYHCLIVSSYCLIVSSHCLSVSSHCLIVSYHCLLIVSYNCPVVPYHCLNCLASLSYCLILIVLRIVA